MKEKWEKYGRHQNRFLKNETPWLNGSFELTLHISKKTGRPTLSFDESSDNSKRRKTASVRAENNSDLLTYAAQMSLRADGKTTEAEVVKKVLATPTYAKDCMDISSSVTIDKISPREALSIIIEAKLSRSQYNVIRRYTKHIFPSYKLVQTEKKKSYPNDLKVTETEAEVSLQTLLDHTATRILQSQKPVFDPMCSENSEMVLFSKWGFDGSSSHTQFKQRFVSEAADDKYMFLTCLVPLRLTIEKSEENLVFWQNPKPSSPRFCRPISLQYKKETSELAIAQKENIERQIKALIPTKVTLNSQSISVSHKLMFTMVDGKICNSISGTKSSLKCYLCDASSKDFNNLENIGRRSINNDYVSFGISVLHAWIRLFESLLHLSYKLPTLSWRLSSENKNLVERTKKDIQEQFKIQLGLIVDKPKPGFGNSNDGNVARKFFQNYSISSSITKIDAELIKRCYIILQTISSGFKINPDKFEKYCFDTASLYVRLYPWMPMTPTLHKILIHGSTIVREALLPIGMLSEEAQESKNKDFKSYREFFSRKTSRLDNITDIINRLFISSDPLLSLMRKLPILDRKMFDNEVINMLEEEI